MLTEAFLSFRSYCINSKPLPVDLHIKLFDITNSAGLFYF